MTKRELIARLAGIPDDAELRTVDDLRITNIVIAPDGVVYLTDTSQADDTAESMRGLARDVEE